MRLLMLVLFVASFGVVATTAVSSADPAGCDINIQNVRAIGSDPTKSRFVYGFDISRADAKPLDATLIALALDGTRLQEFAIRGTLPARGAGKDEWSGLAFSVPANAVAWMIVNPGPELGADQMTACPTRNIEMNRVQTSQGGSWPISATDPGMLDLPASLVPAAGAVVPLDVRDAHCVVCKPPEYPKLAMMDARTGRVVIGVDVAADGTSSDFTVLFSSGYADLDSAALVAARASTYAAATANGIPLASHFKVEFEFRLGG